MSTTRLFDQDAYLGEFEATVERSVCEGGMYRVLLDQTAFFPEGGGQPADEGTLDGIFVTDVQEIDGEIWHTVEAPLEPGKTVVGKLDFEKRFSNMQNHCGEHIVSGIVHRIYGFNNVGFHMGSDVITVDFDGVLTEEQLYDVEQEANEAVLRNVPVTISYPSKEELETMDYRSKKETNCILSSPKAHVVKASGIFPEHCSVRLCSHSASTSCCFRFLSRSAFRRLRLPHLKLR